MNPLYPLILASGTKEALFAALWLALGEEPGRVVDATFADVRETAKRFGVSLSEQQIRKRVKELEALDVLEIVPRRERGRFDLYVYRPSPSPFPEPVAAKPEPETPPAAESRGLGGRVADQIAERIERAVDERVEAFRAKFEAERRRWTLKLFFAGLGTVVAGTLLARSLNGLTTALVRALATLANRAAKRLAAWTLDRAKKLVESQTPPSTGP